MDAQMLVNVITAILGVLALILLYRIFKGDVGDNKGGMVFALVVLGIAIYFVRSATGSAWIAELLH
jgi:hypothetical protein